MPQGPPATPFLGQEGYAASPAISSLADVGLHTPVPQCPCRLHGGSLSTAYLMELL